jgi:hypothetical protein
MKAGSTRSEESGGDFSRTLGNVLAHPLCDGKSSFANVMPDQASSRGQGAASMAQASSRGQGAASMAQASSRAQMTASSPEMSKIELYRS